MTVEEKIGTLCSRFRAPILALCDLAPLIELDGAMRKKAKAPIDRMPEVLPRRSRSDFPAAWIY